MGLGPVTGEASGQQPEPGVPDRWRLESKIAHDVQGIVVSGYSALPAARALFLRCNVCGGAWLKDLRQVVTITDADGSQQPASMIAFTATGLAKLGLPKEVLGTFLLPFQEGMLQKDRAHRLGDIPKYLKPEEPVVLPPEIEWSGNGQEAATPLTVHTLLIVYDTSSDALTKHLEVIRSVLAAQHIDVVREHPLDLQVDANGLPREHFGFADGVSQPIPFGRGVTARDGGDYPRDPVHGVPLGEILLGYENAHGEIPPGPVVAGELGYEDDSGAAASTAKHWSRPSGSNTTPPPTWQGITMIANASALNKLELIAGSAVLRDLGLNGTYLAVRELRQDVPTFWTSLDQEAKSLNELTGVTPPVDADWLAERIVGRTKDGALLCPGKPLAAAKDGQPRNDALFFHSDVRGLGCPVGSHVRRSNPRDGLAKDAQSCAGILHSTNNHRILRRGRKFGRPIADLRKEDGEKRGILFMSINADIERQFEFVQQNWVLNPHFATLFNEVDPLIGRQGPMTLPGEPLRRMINVKTYVAFTGGEYFFLPSIRALDYFEALQPADPQTGVGKS